MTQSPYTRNWLFLFALLFGTVTAAPPALSQTVKLPRTGQATCYDIAGNLIACAGTGQDGDVRAGLAWPKPRFTRGSGIEKDCMIDNLTGLMWSRNANMTKDRRDWYSAIGYVNGLTLCGYSDWRLPNINELESLFNPSQRDGAAWLMAQQFTSVKTGFMDYYWSSTTHPYQFWTNAAFVLHMSVGFAHFYNKSDSRYLFRVWPVRGVSTPPAELWRTGQQASYAARDDGDLKTGAELPDPRFTLVGDCVTDNLTGLMWSRDANLPGKTVSWTKALNLANRLDLCGFSDWRIPNRTELWSLMDRSQSMPLLPYGHPFANVQNSYWTSTTFASDPGDAVYIDIWLPFVSHGFKTDSKHQYAWPVRGGKEYTLTINRVNVRKGSGTVQSGDLTIDCGTTCQHKYETGTPVTLTATPAPDSVFTGWSGGGCSGTDPCTVTMYKAKTVTATFKKGI